MFSVRHFRNGKVQKFTRSPAVGGRGIGHVSPPHLNFSEKSKLKRNLQVYQILILKIKWFLNIFLCQEYLTAYSRISLKRLKCEFLSKFSGSSSPGPRNPCGAHKNAHFTFIMSVCLSLYPWITREESNGFLWNLVFGSFTEMCRHTPVLLHYTETCWRFCASH
jgi:hypothetical protein